MSNNNYQLNDHIATYLDYYCDLSHAPEFAVLLQGQWGSGKTWFIKKYCEKLKKKKQKYLYVSLYGMTSFSDIEYAFFQQLHPVLSSKGMAITGMILKGILKGTLKIDLDSDNKDDGSLNVQIPEINPPEYLKNADQNILIFDDLERCKIDLSNLLGYINYFVEHRGLKVILVAHENELLKNPDYKFIKEKLIGKTFEVSLDFTGALNNLIAFVQLNTNIQTFLDNKTKIIEDIYGKAGYKNLRILKQIILDFERICKVLPEKARKNSAVLREILSNLTIFLIENKIPRRKRTGY